MLTADCRSGKYHNRISVFLDKGRGSVNPIVTVAIPTFRRPRLLAKAIRSVLDQTLEEFELVVADNASGDETEEVVRSFNDPRVRYEVSSTNIGPYANMTRALTLGCAPYISVLHDDDHFYPRNLEAKVAVLRNEPGVGTVHGPVDVIDADGNVVESGLAYGEGHRPLEPGLDFILRSMRHVGLIDFSSAVMRRSCVRGHEFRSADKLNTCLGFRLRVAVTSDVAFVDEVLVARMQHEASWSTTGGVESAVEGTYGVTVDHVIGTHRIKSDFLDEHSSRLPDADYLRRENDRHARRELAFALDRETWVSRDRKHTFALARKAAEIDARSLVQPRTIKALAAAAAGKQIRDHCRRVRHRFTA